MELGRIRAWLWRWGLMGAWLTAMTLASTPSNIPLLHQASDLVEWGRWKEARALLAPAVSPGGAYANTAPVVAYYAHLLLGFGDWDGATQWAEKAVKLDDNCASCHLFLFEVMARRAEGMSQMRALLYLPKIKKQLERATALAPDDGDVNWGWIELDLDLPTAVGGSVPDAMKHAELLGRADPVDGLLAQAKIARASGKPELALADYQEAAKQHPDDARGVFELGKVLYQSGDYAAAAEPLKRAAESTHESVLYSGYEAAELVRLGHIEEARTALEAAQREHPDSRLGDYLVAAALQAMGQDGSWARVLLNAYLAVPPEPDQPTATQARKLEAMLG